MTRREMKEYAKATLKGNWGIAILAVIAVYVINAAASAAFGILELVISGPISVGLVGIFLNLYRKKQAQF